VLCVLSEQSEGAVKNIEPRRREGRKGFNEKGHGVEIARFIFVFSIIRSCKRCAYNFILTICTEYAI